MREFPGRPVTIAFLLFAAWSPQRAAAAPCAQTISKASAKFVQTSAKAVQRCHDARMRGQLSPGASCVSDPTTVAKVGQYRAKFLSQIDKACGGADGLCGTGDDPALGSYGWGGVATCPTL